MPLCVMPISWMIHAYEFRFPDKSCEFNYSFNKEILSGNYIVYCNNTRNKNIFLLETVTKGNGFYNYQVLLIDSINNSLQRFG
jgi:hypothetical protein